MRGARIVAAVLACASVAGADENVDRFAPIREQIAAGKLADARAALGQPMESAPERAVALELQFVVDTWIAQGGAPREESGVAPSPPAEWEPALGDARDLLLRGSYAAASFRFRSLASTAPNDVRRAVASELGRVAAALSGRANAPPPTSAPEAKPLALTVVDKEKPDTEAHWYGWQTLLLDAGAVGVTLLSVPTESGVPAVIGGVAYFVGAPLVHAFHDRAWMTGVDLGIRFVLPIVGGVAGNAACGHSDEFLGCLGAAAVGILVGMGVASIVDATALSWESAPVTKKSAMVRVTPAGLVW